MKPNKLFMLCKFIAIGAFQCASAAPDLELSAFKPHAPVPIVESAASSITWGERMNWTNTYEVYKSNFVYGPTPFRITDLRYSDKSNFEIRSVDVFRAADGTNLFENRPVVFFTHGGSWIDGYRDWYSFVAQSFTGEKGWMTVVVDYRLTSSNVFLADQFCPDRDHCPASPDRTKAAWYPDNIEDVAAAFQWTVNHIATNGGNTNQIVIFGHSAGAHLTSLLATHASYAALRSSMKCVVTMSGVYALSNIISSIPGQLLYGSIVNQTWHGGVTNRAALVEASPDTYVSAGNRLPPFQILYSPVIGELPGFTEEGQNFHAKLVGLGYTAINAMLTGYDHASEMVAIAFTNELPTRLIIQFIENLLTPTNAPAEVTASDGTFVSGVAVTWSEVSGATSYEIWRNTLLDAQTATKIAETNSTQYLDTSALPGQPYYYCVKSKSGMFAGPFGSADRGWRNLLYVAGDFDGDGKADPAMVVDGNWYVWMSSAGYQFSGPYSFGAGGEMPIAADFDGDGKADPAMTANNYWLVWCSFAAYQPAGPFLFDKGDGIPVAGDFDGDGRADPALVVGSNWYVWMSAAAYQPAGPFAFGESGTMPVAGDFDADGRDDPARASGAVWCIWPSTGGYKLQGPFHLESDGQIPVAADFDGDGKADPAMVGNSGWFVWFSANSYQRAGPF